MAQTSVYPQNPTRSPKGISTAAVARSTLWNYTAPDPTKNIVFFEDFATSAVTVPIVTSGLAAASNSAWVFTVTEAGAGNAATSWTNGNGGLFTITNDAANNDLVVAQNKVEFILPASNKRIWFKSRFKVSDATNSAAVVGLQVTNTDPTAATDGIYFYKAAAAATVDCICRKNTTTGSTSATSVATMADDTFIVLGYEFDGVRYIKVFVDEVHKTTIDLSTTASAYLPDTTIAMTMFIKNGAAAAKSMTVDYLFAACER